MPPTRSLRRDLSLSLADAASYGVMVGVGETYLPAFALAAGIAPVAAGLVATVPLLVGGLLQLAAPRAIARVGNYRRWVVGCAAVQGLAFVPLAIAALLGRVPTVLVFAAAGLYWGAGMAASAGWNGWMAKLVPEEVRGRFFARRQSMSQVTMLCGLAGAGLALQLIGHGRHALTVYAGMFTLAAAARLTSALLLERHGRGVDATPRRPIRLRSVAPRLRGTSRASLLTYLVVAFAATSLGGPFLTPFLLREQHLAYGEYTIFVAAVAIAKIAALPVVGNLIKRTGPRRMLTFGAFGIAPLPFLWGLSGSIYYLVAMQIYAGVVWAAFELSMFLTLFSVDDENERTTLQVWFSGLQALATAGASIVGGVALASLGSDRDAYFIVFAASGFARLAAVTLLVRHLPVVVVRLPFLAVTQAWVLAIRPWGGTILRPFVEGLERLGLPPWRRNDGTEDDNEDDSFDDRAATG